MTQPPLSIAEVNRLAAAGFVERFGAVYEHSPWVAEGAAGRRPFASSDELAAALAGEVAAASQDRRLALIRAHPDLAGRAAVAGELTKTSAREQAGAGLDRLSPQAHARLTAGNAAYVQRFGFPFVICVRGHSAETIQAALDARLGHDEATERATALAEIDAIARVRLEALVG